LNVNLVLPFISTVIMFSFAAAVFVRYQRHRAPHLLFWGIGLGMFGIGSAAEAYSTLAWNEQVFRSWYGFGAMLNAAWLGQGTAFLLMRRAWAQRVLWVVLALSIIGIIGVWLMPLNSEAFTVILPLSAKEQYQEILPEGAWVRLLTPIFNVYGLIALVGGALYSAWLFWRKRVMANRMMGNIIIAVGALVIGSASTLTRFGVGEYLYLGELVAATLMFSGFLLASARSEARVVAVPQQPA